MADKDELDYLKKALGDDGPSGKPLIGPIMESSERHFTHNDGADKRSQADGKKRRRDG
ncbi:MAG: hypothetical protein HFF06_10595 [Oscillospiraceae bacterium]|jgi:hypothetical protein|nr:hypothetical protein [Oscillospiraceae bacterium]